MENQFRCSACKKSDFNSVTAEEKMFGMGGQFSYRECLGCGHVELAEVPKDIQRYYPSNYYSYRQPSWIKAYLKSKRSAHSHGRKSLLGALMEKKIGPDPTVPWFQHAKVKSTDRILDVGCGSGIFLRDLQRAGFASITGVDPYIERDYCYGMIHIKKMSIFELDGQFDFIMLNHSFEHMLEPVKILQEIRRLISKEGRVLIRVPVLGEAWRIYRENWVQLDAPRHFFIPTLKSFGLMAQEAGFTIEDTVFDSSDFQFWASEQYRENIALESSRSYLHDPKGSIFSESQIQAFREQAQRLNEEQKGDQASFYLVSGA